MLEGIQPVISVAQNAIKDILNETQPVPVTIEKIIGEVSRTFNVSPADIRGTKRNANVASARRVAIYILREVTGMSMKRSAVNSPAVTTPPSSTPSRPWSVT